MISAHTGRGCGAGSEGPAPEIGVGTTTIHPLPPDLGGTIFDPPAPDLGQGNETCPIEGLWQFVNFNSDSSLPKWILREGLSGLMLISGWLGWRSQPTEEGAYAEVESGSAENESLLRVTCSPAG
jgi:hypothetical protein